MRLARPPEVSDEVAARIRQLRRRRLTATATALQLEAEGDQRHGVAAAGTGRQWPG
ncbi:MAG: hypothetical protein ACYCZN_10875 [Candidatus Dormibacteria bacterium]